MKFLDKEHEERYKELIKKNGANNEGSDIKAMFFILSGENSLYNSVEKLYDFKERVITPEKKGILSSGQEALLVLAYNLYCNWDKYNERINTYSVTDVFERLDKRNFKLAINAIKIAFNQL